MKVCLQPRLFIHFVWFRMMFLPWITVFPIWQERWHYALCLRYQRFAASRCLALVRLGSFTKHEMDKATVMCCREWKREGERERGREGGRRERKMKRCNGFFCFRERSALAASGSCCLSRDVRAWWSQESKIVGKKAIKYHQRGLIGTECFCNLCIFATAD